ncbi:P pilus assembly chaperone PapD [Serratia fonticola]|jgi:P pilus assembly chaperone PapD|uniref:P pilus assembly chaperone PapD n=1 Tax=Serratia fonticola TaxID=47917 RepID=A0A559T422_SERFO|nr:molecular chaperone [Serratia fonticola]TQI78151.1 P pilus assembly chaperone PapD [Serratia fonticola]TQI94851.1 P pilus assembly chaperone PapD [Serratia fonticola]TVZ69349.1 P pilus assembly chaperone PapD [Serratia fonticola]
MRRFPLVAFSLLLSYVAVAHAGVSIGGSRLVYEGNKKEESISVSNLDKTPYLIQSWVENATDSNDKAPFIVTPPLFRLDGDQQNVLRIVRAGGNLPENKESLFWLNIKSIPNSVSDNKNTLQIAVRSRLKLIFRPDALKGNVPEDVTSQLQWRSTGDKLQITNPTPYYMNFMFVKINGKRVPDANYVAPSSTATFSLPAGVSGREVTWQIINDYGGTGEIHKSAF